MKALLKLVIVMVILGSAFFTQIVQSSDIQMLDEILRQAGIKRQKFYSFKTIDDFRNSPTTNGILTNEYSDIVCLRIIGGSIDSLVYISKLKELRSLILYDNKVTRLDGIENLKHLQYLDIADNKIADISALKELKSLRAVNLEMNRANSVIPYRYYWGTKQAEIIQDNGYIASRFQAETLVSDLSKETMHDSKDHPFLSVGPGNKGKKIASIIVNVPKGNHRINIRSKIISDTDTGNVFTLRYYNNFSDKSKLKANKTFRAVDENDYVLYSQDIENPQDVIKASLLLLAEFDDGELQIDYIDIAPIAPSKDMTNLYESLKILTQQDISLHL
jgi:Leucine-rich repeat (LRR) protein